MAHIAPHNGKYRVFVDYMGVRKTKVCANKTEAKAWGREAEKQIEIDKSSTVANKTFGDVLIRYRDTVGEKQKAGKMVCLRINKFLTDPISAIHLRDLSGKHFSEWQENRLKEVAPGSVLRELTILSSALRYARDEWEWMTVNPLKKVKAPEKPEARTRIHTADELARLEFVAGYHKDKPLKSRISLTCAAYLFSSETALRAGELVALEWSDVFLDKGYITNTGIKPGSRKTKAAVRDIPLTKRAREILEQLALTHTTGPVFGLSSRSLDALFRKIRDRAAINDLHYHDSRHVAITSLSKKYDVLALARIVGHDNVQQLMVYYNPTIDDLVKRVD